VTVNPMEQGLSSATDEGLAPNFARWMRFLGVENGDWLELQVLGVRGQYGDRSHVAHANSPETALSLVEAAERFRATGVFCIVNQINPGVASRQQPFKWHAAQKGVSTSNRDIVARRALFIDVDAVRPSGTSATDAEQAAAASVAVRVYERLRGLLGGEDALGYAQSGNGRQVFVALDAIAESEEVAATIKAILAALAKLEGTDRASIDVTVCDAKRLCPAFGTTKRKGAENIADRPHRRTAFTCAGDVRRIDFATLERLRDTLTNDAGISPQAAAPERRVVAADGPFARANAVAVADVAEWLGLVTDGDVRCPGCENTSGVALIGNGLKCQHNTCSTKGAPRTPGFRTPVDLVAEARGVSARDAVNLLAERFGFDGVGSPRMSREDVRAVWAAHNPHATPRVRPLTDTGNAERLAAQRGSEIRFCSSWKKWLVWDGTRWELDVLGVVHQHAKDVVRTIASEANGVADDKVRAAIFKHAEESESRGGREAIVRLAALERGIGVLSTELDADPWLFNCLNGTIDLRTGQLRPHDRANLLTKRTRVAFDATATCPLWERFLKRVMGDRDDLVSFLQRAVGYALTADVREQVLFFLHGSGSNGKSTFARILLDILGEYGAPGAPDLLMAKRGEAHPTEVADLFGRRLVVCQEIESGRAFSEVLVKQLTGGDAIKARRMREDFWEFLPTHKFFIAANHKPVVKGGDHAIWRRIRLIPFEVTIGADEKDPQLLSKLASELPGILRWAVDGCLAWQRDGLGMAEAVAAATGAYREEEDVFGAFLADACTLSAHARVTAKDLYAAYEHWCQQNGERPVSARAVGIRLSERGLQRIKSGAVRLWSGVSLREAHMSVAADDASQRSRDETTSAATRWRSGSSAVTRGSNEEELRI
jgi:P4 family phage/plasmid primase-like protien